MSYILRAPGLMIPKIIDRLSSLYSPDSSLISINNKILYLDIPKTGSSFIKSSLVSSGRVLYTPGPSYPHSAIFRRPRPVLDDLASFQIYAFIRDPILRFCSVYREKVLANAHNKGDWSPSRFNVFSGEKLKSPSEFIRYLIRLPRCNVDKHLLPQYSYIKRYLGLSNFCLLHVSCISDFVASCISGGSNSSGFVELRTDLSDFSPKDLSKADLDLLRLYYASDLTCCTIASTAFLGQN